MFFVVLSEENPDKRLHRSTESASSKDDSLHTSRDDLCNIRLEQDERPLRDSTLDLSGASKSPSTPNYRLSAAAAAAVRDNDSAAATAPRLSDRSIRDHLRPTHLATAL